MELSLQDASGEIRAKVFQDVDTLKLEFDAGEFVKVQGRSNTYQGRTEIIVDKIRRVMADRDAADGFREDDCIRCSARSADEMWTELIGRHRQRERRRAACAAARHRRPERRETAHLAGREQDCTTRIAAGCSSTS